MSEPQTVSRRRDDQSAHLQVQVAIETTTGKVCLEFSEAIQSFRVEPERARRLAEAILKVCDMAEGISVARRAANNGN